MEERCHSSVLAGDILGPVSMYQPTHVLRERTEVLGNILGSITDTNLPKVLRHIVFPMKNRKIYHNTNIGLGVVISGQADMLLQLRR